MTKLRIKGLPRGFTLIEIMVVVVIIGLLATLIVPNVIGQGDAARVTAAQIDIRAIGNALDLYRLNNSHYPSTEQGLEALVNKPAGFPEPRSWGPEPYLKKLPTDPWGTEFVYINNGFNYELYSFGADGQEGGENLMADIFYRDL
ncbi:MAG: type II secretion system protein GspG [Gammaproteobacteria bacterium]|jgi:general secretion pathway protein G|nr:type II secretion system protein GspG [Gammaproteobacteria bacterium]MCH2351751.1 type II secretion system major pseudopilin GspG [Pseudomonadales bacterium]HAO54673.1 type II secretion system protein GspG [Gammaproteobacteria bacterium]|tara:strand:+ start:2909 stop:3343 length:435 start_codon:yes stop_codon:yes gene_type:complete